MKKMSWFRFYSDSLNSPKVQSLPGDLFKAWVNLLCVTSQCDGALPSRDDLAFLMRMSHEQLDDIISQLIARELIDKIDGELVPHNWEYHQYVIDKSAERQKRYRERKKQSVTECNVSSDVTRDVTVTAPDTEQNRTEESPIPPFENFVTSETEKPVTGVQGHPRPPQSDDRLPHRWDEFAASYPRMIGMGRAKEKYRYALLMGKATEETLISRCKAWAALCRERQTEDRFIIAPASWLDEGRWDDPETVERAKHPISEPTAKAYLSGLEPWQIKIRDEIGDAPYRAWFGDVIRDGSNLISDKRQTVDFIRQRYGGILQSLNLTIELAAVEMA